MGKIIVLATYRDPADRHYSPEQMAAIEQRLCLDEAGMRARASRHACLMAAAYFERHAQLAVTPWAMRANHEKALRWRAYAAENHRENGFNWEMHNSPTHLGRA